MREIKFRYIVKFADRMKSGQPIDKRILTQFFTIEEIEKGRLDDWLHHEKGFDYGTYELIARSQHTGLKDSEGNDVYESDILQFEFDGEYYISGPVSWREDTSLWYFGIGMTTIEPEDLFVPDAYKVIGNLYQNPELLNEPQNANGGID